VAALVCAAALFMGGRLGMAAEIQIRSECRTDGGLVLLSDVADVISNDPAETKKLSGTDLLPAPGAGEKRFLRLRELQDLLAVRGVNLSQHRFSGSGQVTLIGAIEPVARPTVARAAQLPVKQATELVRAAIARYLQEQSPGGEQWTIKLALDTEHVAGIAAAQSVAVSGGKSPWTGPQAFAISYAARSGVVQCTVVAQVTVPPAVVVAVQTINRGSVIRASDVRLQPGKAAEGEVQVFTSLDDVLGKEATRVISTGQMLDEQVVRRPLLVHRGEVITVYARTAGIQVRTNARSRDDGSQGDLVGVETMSDRKTYFARVSGPQEVEVFAQAIVAREQAK